MDEMIKKAIGALEHSSLNEIELTDSTGIRVRVVKFPPTIWYNYPQFTSTPQFANTFPRVLVYIFSLMLRIIK